MIDSFYKQLSSAVILVESYNMTTCPLSLSVETQLHLEEDKTVVKEECKNCGKWKAEFKECDKQKKEFKYCGKRKEKFKDW